MNQLDSPHPENPPRRGFGRPQDASRSSRRSVGTLLRDLSRETTHLLREEGQLARAELKEKLDQFGSGAAELGAGTLLSFAGLMVLLAAAVIGLGEAMPLWLSALIVGAAVALIGGVILARARSNLRTQTLAPERTLDSLRRDADLARDEVERVRERSSGEPEARATDRSAHDARGI